MTEKPNLPTEKRSPVDFLVSIFRVGRFSGKKTKPVPTLAKKVSIKRPPRHPMQQAMTLHQTPHRKPLFPVSKPVRVRQRCSFTSSEFSLALSRVSSSGNLFRGTSGNVKLISSLGNLRPRNSNVENTLAPKTISRKIVVRPLIKDSENPEKLKIEGNDKHKEGKFEEALALYNRAIMLDPRKASYYCDKSAALIGLGRLIEAVFVCREAVRIDPCYELAHHRLATLYFRLGEAEKALYHYKEGGTNLDSKDIAKTQVLKALLTKCKKAREISNWDLIARESQAVISSGADSAPQIYAMLVEALLKLRRHHEASNKYEQAPKFNIESCLRLFGPSTCTYLLIVQAQFYIAAGRFEDSQTSCREANRYGSNNEINAMSKRVHSLVLARSSGNKLFKLYRFLEASKAYSQGLDHDPDNATLLCNRAACEVKLGHFREAIEDCNGALRSKPTYSKARLRRAECYAKLKNWEAALQDYEKLIKESPEDTKLKEAMLQLRKHREESNAKDTQFGSSIVSISSNEQFEHLATLPGICVALFCKSRSHKQVIEILQQVCIDFPSFSFLKVEIQDHPLLAISEGVASIPIVMIYKDGLKVQEMSGKDREFLEQSLNSYRY